MACFQLLTNKKTTKLSGTGKLPRLMFACGEEDPLIYRNLLKFKKHCEEIGLNDIKWYTLPGYKHEWKFWDKAIQEALNFFGLDDEKNGSRY
jgi:putative tributyrin esterase